MVNVFEVYGDSTNKKFLNAKICEEEDLFDLYYTIANVELREIKGVKKLVVEFEELDEYCLVLNKTNAMILADAYGLDTDYWVGKSICIKKVKRPYQGKIVDAIEVVPYKEEEIDFTKETQNSKQRTKSKKKRK